MARRVLFVCLGNICRSPLGEGIFRHLVAEAGLADEIEVDSAGTGGWHIDEPPDERSANVAARNGISLQGQRGRKVSRDDYFDFDLILAMDRQNYDELMAQCPRPNRDRIRMLRSHDPEGEGDVPDPYWSGKDGFDLVFDIVHRSCRALLAEMRDR